jgi:hypothetical protein
MKNKLKKYAKNVTSQYGEDGIIQRVFEILPSQKERWCVEFGAWDGKYLSNTYELITNQNWKGILIEGNENKFPDLEKTYDNNERAILICKFVDFGGKDSLDNILGQTEIPVDFDLLSVDIDSNDYHVWDSLKKYSPKLVVIEFNQTIPSDVEFVQKKDIFLNHGNSLLSLVKLGKLKGYELIATTKCNGFFIKKEYFGLFDINDNSINAIWDTEKKAPRIFQLLDGTLALTEGFKLNWTDAYVNIFDLQKLPESQRHFGDSPRKTDMFIRLQRFAKYFKDTPNKKEIFLKPVRKKYYKLQHKELAD